jgi:hypothetical protein
MAPQCLFDTCTADGKICIANWFEALQTQMKMRDKQDKRMCIEHYVLAIAIEVIPDNLASRKCAIDKGHFDLLKRIKNDIKNKVFKPIKQMTLYFYNQYRLTISRDLVMDEQMFEVYAVKKTDLQIKIDLKNKIKELTNVIDAYKKQHDFLLKKVKLQEKRLGSAQNNSETEEKASDEEDEDEETLGSAQNNFSSNKKSTKSASTKKAAAPKTSGYKKAKSTIVEEHEEEISEDENPKKEAQSAPKNKPARPDSKKTPVDAHSSLGSAQNNFPSNIESTKSASKRKAS